ncbi:pre-peptidase C-terminal domain-containing protein [Anatilimnocola sp. NA78]|uniref:pre-peptidase C-terminal domain-containing protein n=1 Tax=Anatilimnocola sp. NA78 TaxID=3415683 RepID=UPI003CE4FBDF
MRMDWVTRGRRNRSFFRPMKVEALEDRSLMAALDLASLGIKLLSTSASQSSRSGFAAALVDDAYEENDTRATAKNLGTLTASKTINDLVQADANDWYRFTTTTKAATTANVSLAFLHSAGDLDLELYNSFGQRLKISQSVTNSESVSLSGLAAGTYYARVYGYRGVTNPDYDLTVNLGTTTPPPPPTLTDDGYENNDTLATASNLGTLTANANVSNLVLADSNDWFRFVTTATGASTNVVSIGFQNTQGNLALQLANSSGTVLATSNGTGNTESVSLAGLAAGTYYARVYSATGATNPGYSLQIVAPVTTTTPPTTGGFDIQISYVGFTASQRAIFEQAAAKWEAIIVGDLPNATYNGIAVDDLLINASSAAIDGVNGILGQAGYDRLRTSGTRLPYHGSMEFDSADMAAMEANGSLFSVIVHEMGHVLGVGTLWSSRGLLTGAGTSNPLFIGANAVAAYNSIFGTTSTGVPVENSGGSGTRDAHWREATFRTEIMTGYINSGANPLSRITIGSLADLGYSVNYAGADAYTRPSNSTLLVSGSSTNSNTSSVQYSPSRPVLTSVIGQNLASLAGLASQSRVDSLHAAIDQIASLLNSRNSAGNSANASANSAIDLLFAGEANFASEGADW